MMSRKPAVMPNCPRCGSIPCICHDRHTPKPKPKERTIQAWAVVCASEVHDLFTDVRNAREEIAWFRRYATSYDCGPHSIVPLIGKVKVRK